MPDKPTVVTGIVRNTRGQPVPQARVYFTSGPTAWPDIAALTDAEGKFCLSAPAPGTYRLECQAEGFNGAMTTLAVEAGREANVKFRLQPRSSG